MKNIKKEEFITISKNIKSFYGDFVDNIIEEGLSYQLFGIVTVAKKKLEMIQIFLKQNFSHQ